MKFALFTVCLCNHNRSFGMYWRYMQRWIYVSYVSSLMIAAGLGKSYSWYSTIAELRNLTKRDRNLTSDLRNALVVGNATINILMMQIETMVNVSKVYDGTLRNTSGDAPLDKYNQWINQQLPHLRRQIFHSHDLCVETIRDEIRSFPDTEDWQVSHNVLLDLQKLNNLSTKDLALGYVMGTFRGRSISAPSCYGLAEIACTKLDNYHRQICLEWLDEALSRANDTDADYDEEDVTELKARRDGIQRYMKLCSASVNRTYIKNASSPKLKCFLWDNNRHPLLLLEPVRAEFLSVDPAVLLFYDVLSDREIKYVLNNAQSMLGKATTLASEKTIQFDGYRVTHNCWFVQEDRSEIMFRMHRLADAITGLSVSTYSEPLQVANYGVGGQYKPHHDAYISSTDPSTSMPRRATFLYYLTDVQHGGATAFPNLGIAAKPVKGAAIFWHDMTWDGSVDYRGLHGACPVLIGNKWIANKWIRDGPIDKCLEHFWQRRPSES